jgi:hypothetical protein
MLKDLAAVDSKSDSIDLAVVVRARGSCEGRGGEGLNFMYCNLPVPLLWLCCVSNRWKRVFYSTRHWAQHKGK